MKRSARWVLQSACSAWVTVPGAGDPEVTCLQMQAFHSLFRALEIPMTVIVQLRIVHRRKWESGGHSGISRSIS